jgi:hypothetical protein
MGDKGTFIARGETGLVDGILMNKDFQADRLVPCQDRVCASTTDFLAVTCNPRNPPQAAHAPYRRLH